MGDASSQAARSERVQDAVIALVHAQTWIESREVMLAEQACLLAADADAAFQTLIDRNAENERAVALLSNRRALVARAAQSGIEAAYASLITPEYLNSLNEELNALPDAEPRRVDVGRALLAMPDYLDASRRAAVQIELAKSLLTRSDASDRSHLDEAIDALSAAAPVFQSEHRMHEWAGARYLTAVARMRRRSDDSERDLVEAIRCASDAAGVWRGTPQRTGAASALHLLGAANLERPAGRESALSDAVDCFHGHFAARAGRRADLRAGASRWPIRSCVPKACSISRATMRSRTTRQRCLVAERGWPDGDSHRAAHRETAGRAIEASERYGRDAGRPASRGRTEPAGR